MYKCGFIPNEYIGDVIYQSRIKRHNSAKRNYQRKVYECIENDMEMMIDEEIGKIGKINRFAC